jgi:hypothetical protein
MVLLLLGVILLAIPLLALAASRRSSTGDVRPLERAAVPGVV